MKITKYFFLGMSTLLTMYVAWAMYVMSGDRLLYIHSTLGQWLVGTYRVVLIVTIIFLISTIIMVLRNRIKTQSSSNKKEEKDIMKTKNQEVKNEAQYDMNEQIIEAFELNEAEQKLLHKVNLANNDIGICPKCNTPRATNDQFCGKCGMRYQ